jgi:starvation-inducible DNA-binding protein
MGTKKNSSEGLVAGLNRLLAAYQVVCFNTRASHWMIQGENFFELHKVFEQAYNEATVKIDEIAERILTLGGMPLLTGSEMIAASVVREYKMNGNEKDCVKGLLEDLRKLGAVEKELVAAAGEEDDIVSADILTGYMAEQQKTSWMLSQFLNKRSSIA